MADASDHPPDEIHANAAAAEPAPDPVEAAVEIAESVVELEQTQGVDEQEHKISEEGADDVDDTNDTHADALQAEDVAGGDGTTQDIREAVKTESTAETTNAHQINSEHITPADESEPTSTDAENSAQNANEEVTEPPGEEPVQDVNIEESEAKYDYPQVNMPVVPSDMLEYVHVFGYESARPSNLFPVGNDTVFYMAGDVVVFHNLSKTEQTYLRSLSGFGIGALAQHPNRQYFAVGEVGDGPDINIYEWPSLRLYRVLRGGTTKSYSALAFSGNGDKLASVGGSPDYMLTVWDWKNELTILKTKAYSSDVWRVTFAASDDGQLTTSGASHIRFWRMAETFTGLKLQGDIGKFGKAEMCDIHGYVELPDGKVVSGSEWGNMLLWEGGKIKCEIARKGRKPCHAGRLEVVLLHEGELLTAGFDGHVRVWNFDEIDLADAPNELDIVYEMDAMIEHKIGANVHIKSLVRRSCDHEDTEDTVWLAQDANGAIWHVDLAPTVAKPPKAVAEFHAGRVSGIDACPVAHIAASIGNDGTLRLHDYTCRATISIVTSPGPASTAIRWAPTSVDPTGRTIFAGYADGVLREYQCAFDGDSVASCILIKALKPLTSPIKFIECSLDGAVVVVGDTKNLFFFARSDGVLDPIGFYSVSTDDGDLTFIKFKPSSTKLLVGRTDSVLTEIDCENLSKVDNRKTFRIDHELLEPRNHKVKSVMKKIESMKRAAEDAELQKAKSKKKRKEEEDEKTEEELAEEKRAEAAAKAEAEKVYQPEPILSAWYTERDTIMVTAGGRDAGYFYECSFDMDEPNMWYEIPGEKSVANSVVELKCGTDILVLVDDGTLRLFSRSDLSKSRRFPIHNPHSGLITSAVESFDGAYLLTSGEDGNIFFFRSAVGGAADPMPDRMLDSLQAELLDARDISASDAYSIEETKQKSEEDAMYMSADEKKAEIRRQIRMLRHEFEQIIKSNSMLSKAQQLSADLLVLDPLLADKIRKDHESQEELLRSQMAWTLEKHTIAHEKLRFRFLDRVEDPLYVVKTMWGGKAVSTFRLTEVSDAFRRISESIFLPIYKMTEWGGRAKRKVESRHHLQSMAELMDNNDNGITIDRTIVSDTRTSVESSASTGAASKEQELLAKVKAAEDKKAKREARKLEWEELMAKKPARDVENPDDLQELQQAMDNIGDYKLKTSKDFKLKRLSERVTSISKRQQIVMLRQKIHDAKEVFNAYVAKVLNAKKQAIKDIAKLRERLVEVLIELDEPIVVPRIPSLSPDEQPEFVMDYDNDVLDQFKIDIKAEEAAEAAAAAAARAAGGFGGLGAGDDEEEEDNGSGPVEDTNEENAADTEVDSTMEVIEIDPDARHRRINDKIWRPSLLQSMVRGQRVHLEYERDQLMGKIKNIIIEFDNRVNVLLQAKRECEVRIKFAEHQHVVYYRELVHLKSFDKQEAEVERRLSIKKLSQVETTELTNKKEVQYLEKKKMIKELDVDAKQVQSEFLSTLGEGHKFEKYLTRVFKKKVKRKKPGEKDQDESESESSSDEEDYDSEFDDDDDEFDDSVCPPGCDQELFQKILDLRERRLDAEEGLVEQKRGADMLKKDMDILKKKEKALMHEKELEEKELAAVQLAKQAKLNELDTAIPLKLSQIQHMTERAMVPSDLSDSLVFSVEEIQKLKDRIHELSREKQQQKSEYKNIKQIQARLTREKKELELVVEDLKKKCEELQMLKFGALVHLEQLESQGINITGQELRQNLSKLEAKAARTVKSWDKKVFEKKLERDQAIRDNTRSISDVANLASTQSRLASALNEAQSEVRSEASLMGRFDRMELVRLEERINLQAAEVEQLQWEISMLSQKTGTIQPPINQKATRVDTLPPIN